MKVALKCVFFFANLHGRRFKIATEWSSVLFGYGLCIRAGECRACSCAWLFCARISCRSSRRRLAWAHCLLISIPICLSPTVMLPTIPTPNHARTHTIYTQTQAQTSTQHPDPTPAMSPESYNEFRSRQNRVQTHTRVDEHTYTGLSVACNTTSTRHGLEYPPMVSF